MKYNMKKFILVSAIILAFQTNIVFANPTFKEEQNIKIDKTDSIEDMFPGESGTIVSSDLQQISNNNNFNMVVCLDFKANTKAYIAPNYPYFEAFRFQKDYDYFSEIGKIFYHKRLYKIMNLEMNEGNEWIKSGDCYYTFIKANSAKELNNVVFSLLPELGGGTITSENYPDRTLQRPWEQNSYFDLGYKLTLVNATEEAVSQNFGNEILDEIKNKSSENWFN